MKEMKTLTLGGEQYKITDPEAAKIKDGEIAPDSVWSSQKIFTELGNVESALDGILAMQNSLIGGDSV